MKLICDWAKKLANINKYALNTFILNPCGEKQVLEASWHRGVSAGGLGIYPIKLRRGLWCDGPQVRPQETLSRGQRSWSQMCVPREYSRVRSVMVARDMDQSGWKHANQPEHWASQGTISCTKEADLPGGLNGTCPIWVVEELVSPSEACTILAAWIQTPELQRPTLALK